ncbi:MAG TPA: BadF/BadG/BcrA/BcrD ATPase family protein [Albidovulum sp.]|uniref:BadF/BadG/BcrA/BcrD ATPase family protein n=1 Tax=Albidovulum sp. TaxID=1872424 RepID=UPI002C1B07FE|nr:BadF/BadG/BcrA/BcrD ATPase family protein [Albidovulum sp.]
MAHRPKHILAIDGGGTSCRGRLFVAGGAVVEAVEGPANVFSDFEAAVGRILRLIGALFDKAGTGAPADTVAHLGLAGVIDAAGAEAVAARLPFARSVVTSDQPTMIVGALGGRDGAVAAIGTGSFVGVQSGAQVRVLGGWGLAIGDQASGAWLGRELLKHVILVGDGIEAASPLATGMLDRLGGVPGVTRFSLSARPADYGRFAPEVVAAAEADDPLAARLMAEGAEYIVAALRTLGWSAGERLCLSGGLGPTYARWLPDAITTGLVAPDGTALDGAAILARRLAEDAI